MTKRYRYRAMLTSTECYGKRPVAFTDNQRLNFWEAGEEAADQHLFSQTCMHCGQNHTREDYAITDLERGEWNQALGDYRFETIYPARNDERQPYLELGV